jgi:hypothetical protein
MPALIISLAIWVTSTLLPPFACIALQCVRMNERCYSFHRVISTSHHMVYLPSLLRERIFRESEVR